jgi:ubiquitin C-terminal hydrolase
VKTTSCPEICKKITGFVGLINEGTTCYMNSLLQTLFLITSYRKAIYSIPISDSEEGKIPKALAKLFAALQLSAKPLSTQELLKSFGWARDQWHEQQDVQEFSYKFSDTLEKSMNGTPAQGTYTQLFKGQILQKIKCTNVQHESEKFEDFIDLQLDVKGFNNIYLSLDKYVEPVALNGDMQYEADGYGKQDAIKYVKFQKLPAVLQIQLKRFEFNSNRGMMTKVNEKFEFYPEIDMNPYTVQTGEFNKYRLFSIMVHSGTLAKGHYSSFISPSLDDNWFQFNDATVDKALPRQAIEANWGGEIEDISLSNEGNITHCKKKCDSSAYMLVYIRINEKNNVLPYISDNAIPPKLKSIETVVEGKPREVRRVTRSACYNIAFATKETILGWENPGIAHFSNKSSFLIYQARKNCKFQEFIDTKLAYISDAKLWGFAPGPVSWKFQEINLQDTLSSFSVTEDVKIAVFIESKHKVILGSSDNWTWNDQEASSINGKQENSKTFVVIKKFENNSTKVIGTEWISENRVFELRKRLFEKYFDPSIEGWMCLERASTDEIRIEEMYAFIEIKKNGKNVLLENGDALILGWEGINACELIRKNYNTIQIKAIYHDNLTFFEFKSFSRTLFEKHQLGKSFNTSMLLSSSQLEVMKSILLTLNIPELQPTNIQLLNTSYQPFLSKDFFLSKILVNNKLYFDILDYNTLDEKLHYQTLIQFTSDFTPIKTFSIQMNRLFTVGELLEKLQGNYEIFLFKYQQKAVLNFLSPSDSVSGLAAGVVLGVREPAETLSAKERVRSK